MIDTLPWSNYLQRFNHYLADQIHQHSVDSVLKQAMQYSCLNQGKRLRPLLCYALAHDFHVDVAQVDAIAAAVELIHCYSLIHDDLPAMDDDDWRRDQPSCHKKFPEHTAILAGNALQAMAYATIGHDSYLNHHQKIQAINILQSHTGAKGLLLGQDYDLSCPPEVGQSTIDELKTARLFQACVSMTYHAVETIDNHVLEALQRFASAFGQGFQRQDDAFDAEFNQSPQASFQQAYQILASLGFQDQTSHLYLLTNLTETRLS